MQRLLLILLVYTQHSVAISQVASEDVKVYSVIVDSIIEDPATTVCVRPILRNNIESKILLMLLSPEQDYYLNQRTFGSRADSITRTLIMEFHENRPKGKLRKNDLGNSTITFSERNMKKIFGKSRTEGWNIFYKRYPGSAGIINFSTIHYSEDKKFAVLFYSVSKHYLNGYGAVAILSNIEGVWSFRQTIHVYVN